MEKIKLNFVRLQDQSTPFVIYRKKVADGSVRQNDDLYRCKLPIEKPDGLWHLYDISFKSLTNFKEFQCLYGLNASLSEHYLFELLKIALSKQCDGLRYDFPENSKYKEVIFFIEEKSKGTSEVVVHPYFLSSQKALGFLFQNKFTLKKSSQFDRQVQIESLSLDKSGRPNVFIYRDKETIINTFLGNGFNNFCRNSDFDLEKELQRIEVRELDRKSYIVGNGQSSQSQFMGIRNVGPYKKIREKVRYLFLFSERTRSLARDLYLGLTGKLFPAQFPGLSKMFGVEIRKDLVDHYSVDEFSSTQLSVFSTYLSNYTKEYSNVKVMLIVALPKGIKDNDEVLDAYGYLKLASLENQIYCQFVTEDTFYKKDLLKWSVSNIGLQIFSKLGGIPWLVKPAKNDCLILGLGSSHELSDGTVKKWFAYTVCLDSSGEFKYIKPLSSSTDETSYIESFKENLKQILQSELGNYYKSFVLHLPFKIKRSEINAIKDVVHSIRDDNSCEVVVIRINTHHKYTGFSDHNTRVPYESSLAQLSYNQFLLWPEGLQHGKEVLHNRVSEPLFIDFIEPPDSWDSKRDCLQDILNLTGTNWRGFNSKAQPISILYSKLIADFMKEFSHLEGVNDLGIVKAESVAPWFL